MAFTIRPFTDDDYPVVCALLNRVDSEYHYTVEEMRFRNRKLDPKCKWGGFVAEAETNGIIGMAQYDQRADMYHPRKFDLRIMVAPERQGQGVGRALYGTLMDALAPFHPVSVSGFAAENAPRPLRFLRDRGFVEALRTSEARLDPAAFAEARFAPDEARVRAQNLVIRTLADLADDPERDRKLYDLDCAIIRDVPGLIPRAPLSFEGFVQTRLQRPGLLADGYFVAVDRETGQYVGLSTLNRRQDDYETLHTGLTGVHPQWRRRGIALVLKVHAARFARAQGCRSLRTWNASHNVGILAVNTRLGFVRQPERLLMVKTLAGG